MGVSVLALLEHGRCCERREAPEIGVVVGPAVAIGGLGGGSLLL